jgi:hypothetical protein
MLSKEKRESRMSESNGGKSAEQKVAFDYIKGQQFKVIHADGAIGGLTAQGNIQFALYSERRAIPRRMVHMLKSDGSLSDAVPSETVSRDAIVREMDVSVVVSPDTATSIAKWLLERVEELKKLKGEG